MSNPITRLLLASVVALALTHCAVYPHKDNETIRIEINDETKNAIAKCGAGIQTQVNHKVGGGLDLSVKNWWSAKAKGEFYEVTAGEVRAAFLKHPQMDEIYPKYLECIQGVQQRAIETESKMGIGGRPNGDGSYTYKECVDPGDKMTAQEAKAEAVELAKNGIKQLFLENSGRGLGIENVVLDILDESKTPQNEKIWCAEVTAKPRFGKSALSPRTVSSSPSVAAAPTTSIGGVLPENVTEPSVAPSSLHQKQSLPKATSSSSTHLHSHGSEVEPPRPDVPAPADINPSHREHQSASEESASLWTLYIYEGTDCRGRILKQDSIPKWKLSETLNEWKKTERANSSSKNQSFSYLFWPPLGAAPECVDEDPLYSNGIVTSAPANSAPATGIGGKGHSEGRLLIEEIKKNLR